MISVITWDAGFREAFHTVDCFSKQTLSKEKYEFIWVDYYSKINRRLEGKIRNAPNAQAVCYGGTGNWHLGRAINHAVRIAKGDLLVITDGDIAVNQSFLEQILEAHQGQSNKVIYCRRWDEPKPDAGKPRDCVDLERLESNCFLSNATNYGGCITLGLQEFESVGGYEEHDLFSEAGAIGKELYTRLKNAGMSIVWHPDIKVYHPWHLGSSPGNSGYLKKLEYQLEFIRRSDLLVRKLANEPEVAEIARFIMVRDSKPSNIPNLPNRLRAKFRQLFANQQ